MLLNVAISIRTLILLILNAFFPEKLLIMFVKELSNLYGASSLSYIMLSLIHIYDDVRRFGALDNYSAFPSENMLGTMKKW